MPLYRRKHFKKLHPCKLRGLRKGVLGNFRSRNNREKFIVYANRSLYFANYKWEYSVLPNVIIYIINLHNPCAGFRPASTFSFRRLRFTQFNRFVQHRHDSSCTTAQLSIISNPVCRMFILVNYIYLVLTSCTAMVP